MLQRTLVLTSAIVLAASPAAASKYLYGSATALVATASPGACGGSVSCVSQQDQEFSPATNAQTATATDANTAYGGLNTASAAATTNFGAQHVYAQAFAGATFYGVIPTYAETRGASETYDVFDSVNNYGATVTGTFSINGSLTPTTGLFGANSEMFFQFLVYDITTGDVLLNYINERSGSFTSPDTFTISYTPPAGTEYTVDSYFEADAYVSSYDLVGGVPLNVVADFSHTLSYRLTAGPGAPDVIGDSGHDYSLAPAAGAVPEPATWAMLVIGFGATGILRRRQPGSVTA